VAEPVWKPTGAKSPGDLDAELPNWRFDDATLERAAVAFDNPDYVDVVLHSYRHRLGLAPSYLPTTRSSGS